MPDPMIYFCNRIDSWYLFWCLLILSNVIAQDPTVNLPHGRIVGIKVFTKASSLTPVEAFFGVPYAAYDSSPGGTHRFSAPKRHPGWSRTLYAHRMPPRCPQLDDGENDNYSEDCLFLNIWTPRRADGSSLPVVVILYSETWLRGGVSLPCQELAAEGVVVVTVAYRLHALAFFSLASSAARGNLALLDQYLAMLWVRENIAAFGGDPAMVTLLGHSAGADSVIHHIASPRTLGLFQRAIVMSPRDIWHALGEDMRFNATDAEKASRELAYSLGCTSKTDQEILRCLRTRPLSDIVALYSNSNWSSTMRPVPDTFLPESQYYLPTSLSVALSASKQPVMQLDLLLGNTDLEAINYSDGQYDELLKRSATYVTEYIDKEIILKLLQAFSLDRAKTTSMLSQAVKWEYWGVVSHADADVVAAAEAAARAQSAATWGAGGALLAARLARRVARLYVYRYAQPGGVDLRGRQINHTGAVHGTDLVALLGDALMLQVARRPATRDERKISSLFQKYITNFIKFGSPGPEAEWARYRAGEAHVQEVRECEGAECGDGAGARAAAFWLQYLPGLAALAAAERPEQLTSGQGESRLRGGVFALCGVAGALLLLLCACALVLRRERARRTRRDLDDLH